MRKRHQDTFYVDSSIVPRWKQVVRETDDEILVFSPYVTGPVAHQVLSFVRSDNQIHLYTLFDPHLFLARSSTPQALLKLLKAGVHLYELPTLHAKILITGQVFASIGSQNLTAGGTTRLEASMVTTSPDEVRWISKRIERWRSLASPISEAMILHMINRLRDLLSLHKKLRNELTQVKNEVVTREEHRKEEERKAQEAARKVQEERQAQEAARKVQEERQAQEAARKAEEERQQREDADRVLREQKAQSEQKEREHNERERRIRMHVRRAISSRHSVPAQIRRFNNGNLSLLPSTPANLTQWTLDNHEEIMLEPLKWYPCLIIGTWRLGYVRLTKTRISFVGTGGVRPEEIDGQRCTVKVTSNWYSLSTTDYNVEGSLTSADVDWARMSVGGARQRTR
jgi:hypothetical protein